ncbi:MAG: DUF2023 family protein [Halanaerobiales bacterium]|nr:DUF2023 family protein [Halanaerobiales bacterium]
MKVFCHHLYEYEKGLRNLILHTAEIKNQDFMIKKLESKNITYVIYQVSSQKINIIFGDQNCVDVIKEIGKKNLKDYTDEEDFMLGIMLGYDRLKQCERYLKRKVEKTELKAV